MARKGNKGRKGSGSSGPAIGEFSPTMQRRLAFKRIEEDKTLTAKQRLRLKRYTVLKENGLA